jgi:hypothetical protein
MAAAASNAQRTVQKPIIIIIIITITISLFWMPADYPAVKFK